MFDTKSTANAVCPYCGVENKDSQWLDDFDTIVCDDCGALYDVVRSGDGTYTTKAIMEDRLW